MVKPENPDSGSEETTIVNTSRGKPNPSPQESSISSRSGTRYVPPRATVHNAEVLRRLGPGVKVRKYRILRELGRGGQGRVFLALDEELGRQVALKTIAALPLLDEATFQRFHNEGLAAARLRHPNVVQLYDVFEEDGVPFLAMEYLEGETLLSAVKGGRLTRTRLLEILVNICEAMGHAHREGLIHRDLKPQNVMLTKEGEPKVMDFGLAKSLLGGDDFLVATLDGQLVGSPAYMSPEQASGLHNKIGPATDVYALGTMMYQCLSGQLPHRADTAAGTMMRIIRDEPLPLKTMDPTAGEDLNAICMKALEKEPRDRYLNAGELAADLKRYLAGEPIQARPTSTAARWMKVVQRNKDVALVSGAALAIMAIALSLGVSIYSRQSVQRDTEALRTKLLTAASYAAMAFPPENLMQIKGAGDVATSAFKETVKQLNVIRLRRDANIPSIQEAFILRPEADSAKYVYVADADAADQSRQPGSPFVAPPEAPVAQVFRNGAPEARLIPSRWGVVFSGYAPIMSKEGQPVSVLGIETAPAAVRTVAQSALRTIAQVGGLAGILFTCFTVAVGVRIFRSRRARG